MCVFTFSTHPVTANPITVTASVTDVNSRLAGEAGPTVTCTVEETTRGPTNTPSAVWMNVSGPVVSGNGVTVTETVVNDNYDYYFNSLFLLSLHISCWTLPLYGNIGISIWKCFQFLFQYPSQCHL